MPHGCFWLHNQWCNNAHSCMTAWWCLVKGGHELTHNTPEYLQTCHKINNSIVRYKKIFNRIHISWSINIQNVTLSTWFKIKMNIMLNKQNKRKLYTFRHMWIRQALKPANDTRDQELNSANNIKWNTNHNKLLTKTITLVSNRSI